MMANVWFLCLVASLAYMGLFVWVAHRHAPQDLSMEEKDGILFGFCTWGLSHSPNEETGCQGQPINSHTVSFAVDTVMAAAVGVLYLRYPQPSTTMTLFFAVIGFIIFFHALLHLFLFVALDCYVAPREIGDTMIVVGYSFFALFSLAICNTILGMGFADQWGWNQVFWQSILCTGVAVAVTVGTGMEWLLPPLFAMSHILSSYTALVSKSPLFTQPMGWVFLMATLTGITELAHCSHFLQPLGGHVWYDFWLHLAVILALPPFAPPFDQVMRATTNTTIEPLSRKGA